MIVNDSFDWSIRPRKHAGLFLVVDGVNGAGKSTLLAHLRSFCEKQYPGKVFQTAEPGSQSSLGKDLRRLILSPEKKCPARSELFLFLADRAAHVDEIILPRLQAGECVLSDRYYYSTMAFQGYGREFDTSFLLSLNEFAIAGCRPDLVFLLDLPPELGLQRAALRGASHQEAEDDRLEGESLAFHKRVRQGFLDMATSLPEPFVILDATQSPEAVAAKAIEYGQRVSHKAK